MNFDLLMQTLKHGYGYTVTTEEEPRQVLVPPNKYMLEAAKAIQMMMKRIESDGQQLQQLNQERNQLINEIETLKKGTQNV